jgi:uncharacterized membrane protein YjfL (UPF0719 family)
MNALSVQTLLATLLYTGIGIFVFVAGFLVFDKITPYNLWKEIVEKQNTALAVFVGTFSIAIAIIIAAAIHG